MILDMCCGSKMFYIDRENDDVIYCDKRSERHELTDKTSIKGYQELIIKPDIQCDFTRLPFKNNQFTHVIFDPPHLLNCGNTGWLAKKYGQLFSNWEMELAQGFSEAFRVLKKNGTLIFKWNERDIKTSEVLSLAPKKPIIGNRSGKHNKTHWYIFIK